MGRNKGGKRVWSGDENRKFRNFYGREWKKKPEGNCYACGRYRTDLAPVSKKEKMSTRNRRLCIDCEREYRLHLTTNQTFKGSHARGGGFGSMTTSGRPKKSIYELSSNQATKYLELPKREYRRRVSE